MPTLLTPLSHHLPHRPSWACQHCDRLWPCPTEKGRLAVEFAGHPVLLIYYMSAQLVECTRDLAEEGEVPAAATLYPRFISWVRRATMTARAA